MKPSEALRSGVSVVSCPLLSGLGVHSRNATVGGRTFHRPHAVAELLYTRFQSGAANQLPPARKNRNLHDPRSVEHGSKKRTFECETVDRCYAPLRTWDALNKANQGGIAIFGAQVVAFAGYRGCFVGTFLLLFLRASVAQRSDV